MGADHGVEDDDGGPARRAQTYASTENLLAVSGMAMQAIYNQNNIIDILAYVYL